MVEPLIEIINSPILALTQNKGDYTKTYLGISPSGAMDEYAYHIANNLLSNTQNTTLIEINFSNFCFISYTNTTIAITGAKCEFFINETPQNTWQTFNIKKGDKIEIKKILQGQRVYIAIKDGFNTENNKTLKKKDILSCNNSKPIYKRKLKERYIPKYGKKIELRVSLSYQSDKFNNQEKNKFFSTQYEVSSSINRMGYKLLGEPIKCDIDNLISEGIAFGSIQIPQNGLPIILLKERQTIGGYPKIGVVLDVDCFKLSQARIGDKIFFKEISIQEAWDISRRFYSSFRI